MIFSPARQLANLANAQHSTGPKTDEGKARSRANALKHGLTGRGIALPDEDAAEIARRFGDLEAELDPKGAMGRILVHRIAFLSVRLERCEQQEAALLGEKIRHAVDDHDMERDVEVARLIGRIGDEPAVVVRQLLRTPEGVDATIYAWLDLKADLGRPGPRGWTLAHCQRANNLLGLRMDDFPISRVKVLSLAIWGEFGLLKDDEGAGLDDEARRGWAKARLLDFIDEQVRTNVEYRELLDLEAFKLDRAEAGKRAMFDTSKEATLARRYEAAAERGMFRALKDLRQVNRQATENPPKPQAHQDEPLGSFRTDYEALPEQDDGPPIEPRKGQSVGPDHPTTAIPRSPRFEFGPAEGMPASWDGAIPRFLPANPGFEVKPEDCKVSS